MIEQSFNYTFSLLVCLILLTTGGQGVYPEAGAMWLAFGLSAYLVIEKKIRRAFPFLIVSGALLLIIEGLELYKGLEGWLR